MEEADGWSERLTGGNGENSFRLKGSETPSVFINPLYCIIVDTNRKLWQVTKLEMKGMLIVLKFDWGYSLYVCVSVCAYKCVRVMLWGVGGGGASGPDAIHS